VKCVFSATVVGGGAVESVLGTTSLGLSFVLEPYRDGFDFPKNVE